MLPLCREDFIAAAGPDLTPDMAHAEMPGVIYSKFIRKDLFKLTAVKLLRPNFELHQNSSESF
jgi:hypothetical protein